jgi:hypothetical protein
LWGHSRLRSWDRGDVVVRGVKNKAVDLSIVEEVGGLVVVEWGIVNGWVEKIGSNGIVRRDVVGIILGVIYRVVVPPLNDEAAVLD